MDVVLISWGRQQTASAKSYIAGSWETVSAKVEFQIKQKHVQINIPTGSKYHYSTYIDPIVGI